MIIAVQAGYPVSDMNVTKTKVKVDNKTHGPHHNFSRQIHCILCLEMFNTCIGELNDEHKKICSSEIFSKISAVALRLKMKCLGLHILTYVHIDCKRDILQSRYVFQKQVIFHCH